MSPIVTQGYGEGHIVTQGYGVPAVVGGVVAISDEVVCECVASDDPELDQELGVPGVTNFNTHDLGDSVKVNGVFTTPTTGAPLDPETVKLSVLAPDGTLTTYVYNTDSQVQRDSQGVYFAYIDANLPGTWYYRWWATGQGQAADETHFEVRNSEASA